MRKAYKFKLFHNRKRANRLNNELRIFCHIYNHSLRVIKTHYKIFGKNPSKYILQKHLIKLSEDRFPMWKALGYSQGIQDVTDRIYKSYDAFFKWVKTRSGHKKSPPKFKAFRKYRSFTLKQAGWKLDQEKGSVRIGPHSYRYNNSRKIEGVIKTVTIKRDQVGDWYVIFSCDLGDQFIPKKNIPMTGKSAGFDFGMKTFLISSDNEKYHSPEFLKSSLSDLKKKSRSFSKKIKGSKNRRKSAKSLSRLHRKVSRQRLDHQFKLVNSLYEKYDNIFMEDLSLSGMKKLWGRKVSDLALYQLLKILKFKAVENGKTFHKIDRFYPSSKTCSLCHRRKEYLELNQRIFECECCSLEIDRDLNASINILREGASSLGLDKVIRDSYDLVPVA